MINNVKNAFTTIRQNLKIEFKNIFRKIRRIAVKSDVDIRNPKVKKIQWNRTIPQPQSTDLSKFYYVNNFLPYFDYLISKLNSRFHEKNDLIISNLKIMIPKYYLAYETLIDKILDWLRHMKQINLIVLKHHTRN